MSQISDQDWEAGQAKLGASVLQSAGWARFQDALGHGTVREQAENASVQGITLTEGGFHYLWCPYGPTATTEKGLTELVEGWKTAATYDFVRVEPRAPIDEAKLRAMGFVRSIELNPAHTSLVDLTATEETLRSNLTSGHRNAINGAERRGITIRTSENPADAQEFLDLIHMTAGRRGFRPHSDSYYRSMLLVLMPLGMAKLYLAEADGRVIAAAISLDYQQTRIYAHAGADPLARKLQAAVPLVWQMMLDAKAAGMTTFDLWGVAPEEATAEHAWAGFTQFKRAFGGQDKSYVGTWDLPIKPLKYRAYSVARRLNRMIKR